MLVSVTEAGRLVMDQATARRRSLIEEILATLPEDAQQAAAGALQAFADAAGEVPDSQWPPPGPAYKAARPRRADHLVRAAGEGLP